MQIKEVDLEKTELFSIGRQYSNNVLAIHFVNLPNLKNKFIYYQVDDIEHEIPLVDDLFIVSRPLTLHSGEVKAQIITRDENNSTIELTKNFTMRIQPSNYSGIGEDENYPDDPNIKNYFVKIDEKVNSFEELANLVQTKLDNGDFVGEQGPKGEKGEPGDVTEEYRNLASQIAQNASDAQASATNAQTSATNAKKTFDDTKEFANQAKSELNQIKTDTSVLKDEANTSAVNAKASESKAKEYADNLQASTDDISQLKEDLTVFGKELGISKYTYLYTKQSGYQYYTELNIESGEYYVTNTSTISPANFTDENDNIVLSIAKNVEHVLYNIKDDLVNRFSKLAIYQGDLILYKKSEIEKIKSSILQLDNSVPKFFYCGHDRELNTLKKGIEEATKYMNSTLYVDSGVYDLVEEFGQSWFDNLKSTDKLSGLVLKNRVHIIFSPNSKVISHYTGENQYAQSLYSPFNAGEYGFTLENLTLECSRCRYGVHDERNGATEQYNATYLNCSIKTDNSNNSYWQSRAQIGGGLGSNSKILFDGCVFESDVDKRDGLYYHQSNNSSVQDFKSKIEIKNCYFISGCVQIDDERTDATGDRTTYIITNNNFPKLYAGANTEGVFISNFTNPNSDLYCWNNKIRI